MKEPEKKVKEVVLTHDMLKRFETGEHIVGHAMGVLVNKDLSTQQTAKMLQLYHEHEEQVVEVTRTFEGSFLQDVGVQLMAEFSEKSAAFAKGQMSFFGGETPPQEIRIPVAYGKYLSIPYGEFVLPGMDDGRALFTMSPTRNGSSPLVSFRVKRRYKALAESIIDGVESRLQTQSIFIGQAFQIEVTDEDGKALPWPEISFLEPKDPEGIKLVFNRWIERRINTGVLLRIRNWTAFRDSEGKSKTGALFNGLPGTGKTLVILKALQTAAQEGQIAMLVKKPEDAVAVLTQYAPQFAKNGRLVVVAFEDLDRVAKNRDKLGQALTIALDGADNKHLNIMVLATTNHMGDVVSVLKRSGRFDIAMTIPLPDDEAVERLLKLYSSGKLDPSINLAPYIKELRGVIPADISAILDDARMSGIARLGKPPEQISEEDLEYAVACFRDRKLDEAEVGKADEPMEIRQARTFGESLGKAISERVQEIAFPVKVEPFFKSNGNGQSMGLMDDYNDDLLPWEDEQTR